MIVKNNARYNLIEGIDIHILSNDENHFIEIYNDKKDTSVSMSIGTADLQGLADFIYDYLEEN